MQLLSLLGFGSFVIASLLIGGRLIALAARTRQAPEATLGTALFSGGGLGYLLSIGIRQLDVPLEYAVAVRHLGAAFIHLGSAALALGVWRIFRPSERWALALCLALVGGLATSLLLRLSAPPHAVYPLSSGLHFWPMMILGTVAYGWVALEAGRYSALLRRRVRLGLAEPALQERFVLWTVGAVCAVLVHACSMASRIIDPAVIHPAILTATSLLGFGAAVTLWLTFFPPAWWRKRTWLVARAA